MEANNESVLCEVEKEEISPEKEKPSDTLDGASTLRRSHGSRSPTGEPCGSKPPSGEPCGSKPPSGEAQEFSDARECSIIDMPPARSKSNSPDTERTPLIVSIPKNESQVETFNYGSGSPSDRRMCLPCCEVSCCYSFQRFTHMFFSPITLPYYFLLLTLPVGTGYMATKYILDCPVAANVPILLFLICVCGVVYLIGRIAEIIYYWFLPNEPAWSLQSFFYVFTLGTILLLIITELTILAAVSVNIENQESEHYCNPVFFKFCYYGGLAGLFLVSVSSAMILPVVMCPHP